MTTPRISVGARLLILLSGMAALATVLMLLIQDRTLAADLEQAASARLGKAARAASLLASNHVDSLTRRYRAISGTPQFRATLEVQDVPTLTHYAEQLASREGAALIAFLDASGDLMAIGGDPNLVAWTQSKPGLRADSTRAYALTRIALEASGNALGSLVAIEPITDPILAGWSNLCGAQVLLRPPQFEPQAGVEQVVSSLGDLELRVAFSLDAEHDALVRSRTNLLMAGGVTLGLAFLASFFLSRSIVRPILEIQSATERIAQGDFDVHTPSDRMDEIGDVARAFDVMRDRLRGLLSELRQSRTQLENAQRLARIGSWQMDLQSGELTGSVEFRAMFGLENESETSKAIPHMLVLQQIHPEDRHDFEQAIRDCIEEGTGLSLEHRLVVQDVERIIHTQGQVISGRDGMAGRIEGTCQDVSERKRSEEQIRFLAYHDNLTGLGNRQFIVERLGLAISRARRNDSNVGVLFLGLDHFKRINDTLGHTAGDELLRGVADRLVGVVRDSDLIVRKDSGDCDSAVSHLGSDEFTLLASEIGDPADLAKIAQRVRQSLAEPFDLQGHAVVLQASIGIAAWPIDGDDVETLLRNADTAMQHAKRQGRNNVQFYTESMNAAALNRLTVEEKLRRALDENQFEVHYQPKVALQNGDIVGFEALLRWRDPEIGMVMPNDFIPIAEESGLIVKIGAWVVDEVCRQLAEWRDNGQTVLPVAINLSVQQLREADLATTIQTSLHSAGIEPSLLELEITESMLLGDGRKVRATLNALRVTGIQIAIDDFGTGYSSLSYLRHLPVDILKIDRSFVQNIEADEEDAALAEAIIAMARALRLKVVAEGVETPGQREILANWGCDEYQGFVFSPAVPASEVHGLFPVRSAVSDS